MNEPKYETCRHAISVGEMAIYVHPTCKRANMIMGTLVSSKKRCERCRSWEENINKIRI